MNEEKQKTVSETITEEDILSWQTGDVITIDADVGLGKSYFIINKVYNICKRLNKKILLLTSRKNCKRQFLIDVESKKDVITVLTYQKIEKDGLTLDGEPIDLTQYDYIVSDEYHYFLDDARFNTDTDVSFQLLLNNENSIKIFMSATGNEVKRMLNRYFKIKTTDYIVKRKDTLIKSIEYFYGGMSDVEFYLDSMIKDCKKGEKAIFFISNIQDGYNLHKRYPEETMFVCSEHNKRFAKYMNEDEVGDMLKEEKFRKRILITTTALDVGINIKDEDVVYIVCDLQDSNSVIQALGRKRPMHKNDKYRLMLGIKNNCQLAGRKTQLKKRLKDADLIFSEDFKKFSRQTYRKETNKMLYLKKHEDNEGNENKFSVQLHEFQYFKTKLLLEEVESILKLGAKAHEKFWNRKFNIRKHEIPKIIRDIKKEKKMNDKSIKEQSNLLDELVGKRMYKEDARIQKIIDTFEIRNKQGKILKSHTVINEDIAEKGLPYIIIKEKDMRKDIDGVPNPNHRRVYWLIEEK